MDISPDVRKALDKFPGPINFVEPPGKWRFITPIALLLTVASLWLLFVAPYPTGHWHAFRVFKQVVVGIIGMILFGANTVLGLANILSPPSLRLDESGFVVRDFFQTSAFTWDQVSDFLTNSPQGSRGVKFRADAGKIGERNGFLPDSYGFSARDLSQLMTMWQRMASRPRAADVHSAASPVN